MPSLPQHSARRQTFHQAPMAQTKRKGSTERGYDADWQRLRKAFLAEHPLCWACLVGGQYVSATQVDHKERFSRRPELRLEWSNLQPLCDECHTRKTRWERRRDGD